MTGLIDQIAAVKAFLTLALGAGGRFFFDADYPHQFADRMADANDYLGELRGFYPNTDRSKTPEWRVEHGYFQPYNSMKHTSAEEPPPEWHRAHSGVDIYTPYQPYPHETPVYALVTGTALVRTRDTHLTDGDYQSLGNRVRLYFSVPFGGKTLRCALDYGHLARFAPGLQPHRGGRGYVKVKAGDLIGYSGKSGNADTAHESTTRKSPFKVDACHVHLGFILSDKNCDPLDVLPKPLALTPDLGMLKLGDGQSERATRLKATEWSPPPALRDKQPDIENPAGRLSPVWNAPLPRTRTKTKQSRAILPGLFAPLDFDHTRSLKDTKDAFDALKSAPNLAKGAILHRAVCAAIGENPEETRWREVVGALTERARARVSELKVADGSVRQDQNAALALLSLIHLTEAAWMLLGGPAFAEATKGRVQPASGFGVYGTVWAMALPHGVAAIHRSAMPDKSEVLSVTFGSGSLRHAVLCARATAAAEEPIATYMKGLRPLLSRIASGQTFAYRRFRAIETGDKAAIEGFRKRIGAAAKAATDVAALAAGWDLATFTAFARLMAEHNSAVLAEAEKASKGSEALDGRVFSPEVKGLALVPDQTAVGG